MPPIPAKVGGAKRRRYACERCRSQKLKCYFGTPTSLACIRCVQGNVECSGRDTSDEVRLPQGQLSGGATVMRSLLDLQLKVSALGKTPLQRAIAVGAYSYEEAENMYVLFRESNMSLFAYLCKWSSILEADDESPLLAIAIVTVAAMSISLAEVQKQRSRDFFLDQIWEQARSDNSLDTFLALAVVCAHRLPYGELGVSHIFALHGVMAVVTSMASLTPSQLELVRQTYARVSVPYAFLDSYGPISKLIPDEDTSNDADDVATQLTKAYSNFQHGLRGINMAAKSSDAIEVYENSMAKVFTFLAQNYETRPLRFVHFLVRLKLMRKVAIKISTLSAPGNLEGHERRLLERVIAEANVLGYRLGRVFSNLMDQSIVPTCCLFLVEDSLVNFLAMRFVSFAASIDVDVRTEDFLNNIESTWSDFAQKSSTARQSFVSFMTARFLASLKIGVLNRSTGIVDGPGTMPYFEIYVESPESGCLELAGGCTSAQAHDLLCSVISGSDGEGSPDNSKILFTDAGRSFLHQILSVYMN